MTASDIAKPAKRHGFKIRIDAFLEIDRKDFAKQRDTYALMAAIEETGKLPDDFFTKASITGIDVKQGAVEAEKVDEKPLLETEKPETEKLPASSATEKPNEPTPDKAAKK